MQEGDGSKGAIIITHLSYWVLPPVLDAVEDLFPGEGRLHGVPVEYVVKVPGDKTHFPIAS